MRFRSSENVSPGALNKNGFPYWKQILVSGFYTGMSPFASGTVASAVAAGLYIIPGCSAWWVLVPLSVLAFLVGIPLAGQAEEFIGDDPSFVTLDEFAGQWLALASPLVFPNPWWVLLAFLTFRVFDVAKVFPANYFDRQRGGLGIMADDMVAGLYANITSHLIWYGLAWIVPVKEFLHL